MGVHDPTFWFVISLIILNLVKAFVTLRPENKTKKKK